FARFISAMKEERVHASKVLSGSVIETYTGDKSELIEAIREALYMSKIVSYALGFAQMRAASEEYDWNLDYGNIAMIFRGGCIIRAALLQKIKETYVRYAEIANLLLDPYFKVIVEGYQKSLRKVIALAVENGIAVPG